MNKLKEYVEKCRDKKEQWLILLLAGLLLLVIAIPVSDKEKTKNANETESLTIQTAKEDYIMKMERRLKEVLETVHGVGQVSVMITVSESAEKVIEKDEEVSEKDRKEISVYYEESGKETPYVKKEISPEVEGVLVVAEGGDNPVVIESITSAVQALFGIETHKIKVMKHN